MWDEEVQIYGTSGIFKNFLIPIWLIVKLKIKATLFSHGSNNDTIFIRIILGPQTITQFLSQLVMWLVVNDEKKKNLCVHTSTIHNSSRGELWQKFCDYCISIAKFIMHKPQLKKC